MSDEGTRLTGIQRAMAGAMKRSWDEIPHFAEVTQIDAEPVLDRLDACRKAAPVDAPRVTINDLLVHAVTRALSEDPRFNVLFDGKAIRQCDGVNLAVAIATDNGLMTPVLRDAHTHDIYAMAAALREKADRARAWKLAPDEFDGAVMTVSNLGKFDVDSGFPVINQRQTALLFMGSIKKRPFVINDAVVARKTAYLTLASDHRIIDGVTAASFLERIIGHFTGRSAANDA
ncbi:2-oxo acid dehydrogenase subunit E2 [Maricaulis salignorans]|uniref:2-oxoacid dehydrogenases acyltransferase (Catalytic domain) n=1 Tax=Maricaulis salignorans TaxID=144026 RepID=A0A1G9LRZ5_9PROT|nr:2-oxo acid dehydrogenase subunit E2 [Maricaulis salignorans]SDL64739.1 2-oxoacid dehydrogenases acyltransferase (catalytic domain) [Maricaulis salignorans]